MTVSDNTIQAEGIGSFFENSGKISAKAGKKLATIALAKPGGALEITSNIATAAATKSLQASSSSLPEVIIFYHRAKVLYLGKFLQFILYKWKIKLTDYTHQHHLKEKMMI